MLERMDDFFTARINGYDEHMKSNIEGASLFYKFTAALLPVGENAKLWQALKPDGYFILTDYYAETDEQETFFRQEQIRLRKEQNLPDEVFYHYDTPLTVEHEKEALIAAGFTKVEVLNHWEATYTLKAGR